jgi:hypothetical protein
MFSYQAGAFDGSAAYAATALAGRLITISVSTSTAIASSGSSAVLASAVPVQGNEPLTWLLCRVGWRVVAGGGRQAGQET